MIKRFKYILFKYLTVFTNCLPLTLSTSSASYFLFLLTVEKYRLQAYSGTSSTSASYSFWNSLSSNTSLKSLLNFWYFPMNLISPSSIYTILSAYQRQWMEWVISSLVYFFRSFRIVSRITLDAVGLSKLANISSKMQKSGSEQILRARLIRTFYPLDSFDPFSPQSLSIPSSKWSMSLERKLFLIAFERSNSFSYK